MPETDSGPLRRKVIEPLTRVEGHGKVTLLLDEAGQVQQARLHIVEFRGFERFIQGRPYWEIPQVVQRLCGICPVSHHLAAGKALDQRVGAAHLPPTAEKIRRLLHLGQVLQSHALHFFYLASPDLLFGFESDSSKRNVMAVIEAYPDLALQGIRLRKFGQQLIEAICGKRVHGSIVVPGGVNKWLTAPQIEGFQQQIEEVLQWSHQAVDLAREIYLSDAEHQQFAPLRSPTLSLCGRDGQYELYDGALTVRDAAGQPLLENVPPLRYAQFISEQVKPWSYMKFPFLRTLGPEDGWYRVGPLARLLNCRTMDQPHAESARQNLLAHTPAGQPQSVLLYHWARMIELLYCAEAIAEALPDGDLLAGERIADAGEPHDECVGVIEAPRGTLIHHYRINRQDLVEKANLIVSTTGNNQAMNSAVLAVCRRYLDGNALTERLLNRIEVAIRAFDPCLSCATHALGQMPLKVELFAPNGELLDSRRRSSDHKADL